MLRCLYFQREPYARARIVRCIQEVTYDGTLDICPNFPTFGKYVAVILSEHNKYELYIPRGFAHGFLVLSEEAEVVYKTDNVYNPQAESGIIWNDPDIGINWPIDEPILSEKDRKWPRLNELF